MTELVIGIVVFTLATLLGFELIQRVPPMLHTPLMSGSNAISGITIVGALVVAGGGRGWLSTVLGFLAVVFAMLNVAGGYVVTDRMLRMFAGDATRKAADAKADAKAAATAAATATASEGARSRAGA